MRLQRVERHVHGQDRLGLYNAEEKFACLTDAALPGDAANLVWGPDDNTPLGPQLSDPFVPEVGGLRVARSPSLVPAVARPEKLITAFSLSSALEVLLGRRVHGAVG